MLEVPAEIPAELTAPIDKQTRPPGPLTYRQALELWIRDRESIDRLNARLRAIGKLTDGAGP